MQHFKCKEKWMLWEDHERHCKLRTLITPKVNKSIHFYSFLVRIVRSTHMRTTECITTCAWSYACCREMNTNMHGFPSQLPIPHPILPSHLLLLPYSPLRHMDVTFPCITIQCSTFLPTGACYIVRFKTSWLMFVVIFGVGGFPWVRCKQTCLLLLRRPHLTYLTRNLPFLL